MGASRIFELLSDLDSGGDVQVSAIQKEIEKLQAVKNLEEYLSYGIQSFQSQQKLSNGDLAKALSDYRRNLLQLREAVFDDTNQDQLRVQSMVFDFFNKNHFDSVGVFGSESFFADGMVGPSTRCSGPVPGYWIRGW